MRTQTNKTDQVSSQRSVEDQVRAGKSDLLKTVGQQLGESLTLEKLGPLAMAFIETVVAPRMERAIGKDGEVSSRLSDRMAKDLGDLVDKDRFLAAPPAGSDGRPSVLDGRQVQLVENKGAGTSAIAGAIDLGTHLLGDVLKKFDIPANGIPDAAASAIKVGLDRRADLAKPQTWLSIVPQMAAAALAAKGGWQAKLAAAATAGVTSLAVQPPVIDVEAQEVKSLPAPEGIPDSEKLSGRDERHAKILGDNESARLTDATGDRRPGTMRGGVLGLANARVQSSDNRKIATQARDLFRALAEHLGDDAGELDALARAMSSAASKGVGSEPRLIDLSALPAPEDYVWPQVDPKVSTFADAVLGPGGLNVEVEGGNELVAGHFVTVLNMATQKTEAELAREVNLEDPQDQAAVLRVAVDSLAEVSPTAAALSKAFDAVSDAPSPEQTDALRNQADRHERAVATTWVVEALATRAPDAMATAKAKVDEIRKRVEARLEGIEEPPPELANARTTLQAQAQALEEPDGPLAKAVLTGGLGELQYTEGGEHDPAQWARLARSAYAKASGDAKMKLDIAEATHQVAPNAAQAVSRSALAAIWNVAAETAGAPPLPPNGPGGTGGAGGPPNGPPRGPWDTNAFDAADDYAAGMGARVDKRNVDAEKRENFDEVRAILNDPSIEFFDKMFLVMAMLIDRMRTKIEKDQIDQLDREEMMWINEQLAHEFQKEVEMAQRDIHELGKEVDKSASAYSKADRHLKQLEATPEDERGPDHAEKVAEAKKLYEETKGTWGDNMGRFEMRKSVLNELRDARDAHRVQIASDRRSADIFAAKVKRNTHVVEMYMDLIKTFEEHKKRNLARMFN